jgi:hypothetical protein
MKRSGLYYISICAALWMGCSEEAPAKAGEGEACAVDADCASELVCRAQVCTVRAVAPDMSGGDMSVPDGGGPIQPTPEGHVLSYVELDEFSPDKPRFLFTVNTATGVRAQVSAEPQDCVYGCWLSYDLASYVYLRPSAARPGTFDVWVASVGADLKAAGEGTAVVQSVDRVKVTGNLLSYVKEDNKAYYRTIGRDNEAELGDVGAAEQAQGSWHLDEAAGRVVFYRPTLQTLAISVSEFGQPVGDVDYTVDATNYQAVSGSYFGATIPTAFSRDGKVMATLTNAPNNYNTCQTSADCKGVGQHCGEKKLCTAIEVTVQLFDLERLADLPQLDMPESGKSCTADDQCGSIHQCYIPSATQLDKARCNPRRVVMGLPRTPEQPRIDAPKKNGCDATRGSAAAYTAVRAPMSFGADGALYVLAERKCEGLQGELDIPDTDILKVNPTTSAVSVVYGNPGKNFDESVCYSSAERVPTPATCIVAMTSAVMSPEGKEISFLGTNPESNLGKAAITMSVWSVLADGSQPRWFGKVNDLFKRVDSVVAHPKR